MDNQNKPLFILLTSWSQREIDTYLLNLLKDDIDQWGRPSFLYIGVTKRKCRIFVENLMKKTPCWKPDAMTLPELCDSLFQHFRKEMPNPYNRGRVITQLMKEYCIINAFNQLKHKKEFNYFQFLFNKNQFLNLEDIPGVVAKISEFFSILKLNDLEEIIMQKSIDEFGAEIPGKNEDIIRVYHEYQNLLDENELFDNDDKAVQVRDLLLKKPAHQRFNQYSTLILDGIVHLTKIQEDILLLLLPGFKRIIFTAHSIPLDKLEKKKGRGGADVLPENAKMYMHLRQFFSRIKKKLTIREIHLPSSRPILLSHYLYTGTDPSAVTESEKEKLQKDKHLHIISLHDRVSEVRTIARLIKSQIQKGESTIGSFYLIFPHLSHYLSIIYEIFPQYGIPFNVSMGIPASSIPIAILIKKMFDIAIEFRREDIFSFFSSRLVRIPTSENMGDFEKFVFETISLQDKNPLVQPDDIVKHFYSQNGDNDQESWFKIGTLDTVARHANITGGSNILFDWYLPIESYFNFQAASAQMHGHEGQNDKSKKLELFFMETIISLWILNGELDFFRSLTSEENHNPIITIKKTLSAIQKRVFYYDIPVRAVSTLQHIHNLSEREKQVIIQQDMQSLMHIYTLLRELVEMAKIVLSLKNNVYENSFSPSINLSRLKQLRMLFVRLLQEKKIYQPRETGVIQITEALETRGLYFQKVILGGMTAEDFPYIFSRNFLIPDQIAPDILREINPTDEARFLLSHLLSNAEEIYFTYPQSNGKNELSPSPLIEDMFLFYSGQKNILSPSINAKTPMDEEIYSPEDLFQLIGSKFDINNPEGSCRLLPVITNTNKRLKASQILKTDLERDPCVPFGPFDGLLSSREGQGHIIPELAEQFGADDSCYSVSMLEQFASCPQRFFYETLLGLQPLEEVTDEIEANEIGRIIHEILCIFFKMWSLKYQKITPENRIKAIILMHQAASNILHQRKWDTKKNLFIQHQVELIMSGLYTKSALCNEHLQKLVMTDQDLQGGVKGILRGVIDFEASSSIPLIPKLFEYIFGTNNNALLISCDGYADIKIRGKIDRVDIFEKMSHKRIKNGINGFAVIDYKTGTVPTYSQLEKGTSFQIPVYIMALLQSEQFIKKDFAGIFYSVGNGNDIKYSALYASGMIKDKKVLQPEGFNRKVYLLKDHVFSIIKDFIRKIHKQILSGIFHYSLDEAPCHFCSLSRICRRDAIRIKHLDRLFLLQQNSTLYYSPRQNREQFQSQQK